MAGVLTSVGSGKGEMAGEEPTAVVATRLAGKRHPEQGQIGGCEERDTGAAPRRSARSGPSGRPHEARSNPGPREMTAAASSVRTYRHRIRLTAPLPHALKRGQAPQGACPLFLFFINPPYTNLILVPSG